MKALALVDAPDHVCCRYRIGAFASALESSGCTLEIEPIVHSPTRRLAQLARTSRYDCTILQRKLLPLWQLRLLRSQARRLVFDFDDAVLYRDSYDPRGPHCSRRSARFRAIVRCADRVLAGNAFLAACAVDAGAASERVRMIPTCIDPAAYAPAVRAETGAAIDLVWIGSSSTLQGLECTRPLWERIADAVPGVRLRVICDRFPGLGRMPVVPVPWSETTEASALAAGDVGVSWIPDDLWSRGKCGLKVLQYMASALPVLANPVGVHPEMIRHGISGRLVDDPDDWIVAVRTLAADPAERRWMGAAGRAAVEAEYSVAAWAPAFVAAVTGQASGQHSGASGKAPAHPGPHLHDRHGRRADIGGVGNT